LDFPHHDAGFNFTSAVALGFAATNKRTIIGAYEQSPGKRQANGWGNFMSVSRHLIAIVAFASVVGVGSVCGAQDLYPQPEPPGRHDTAVSNGTKPTVHPNTLPPGPCHCTAPATPGDQHKLPPGPCRCEAPKVQPKTIQ